MYKMSTEEVVRYPDGFKIAANEYFAMSNVAQFKLTMAHGGHFTYAIDTVQVQTGTRTIVDTPAWDETVVVYLKWLQHILM